MWPMLVVFALPLLLAACVLVYRTARVAWASHRARDAEQRIRAPDANGVADTIGFTPAAELVDFFKTSPWPERYNLGLKHPERDERWWFGSFIPLHPLDAQDHRVRNGPLGLPFADDGHGGSYIWDAEHRLWCYSDVFKEGRALVASSPAEFFVFVEAPEDIANESPVALN
jgi:hypothetical protein